MQSSMMGLSKIPRFFYGTAWKEQRTEELTFKALQTGFRAVDTANQRKHYFEEGAGRGIKKFLAAGTHDRSALFLQTKFTFARGQDHRKPYNEVDPFARQVADSFASSLRHLQTHYIDSYVLHGPYGSFGIGDEDLETWSAMEKLVDEKKVNYLGVSNISPKQLTELCKGVRIKPRFVQNRCFARLYWDKQIREICNNEGITYQGFSLLTANRQELSSSLMEDLAHRYHKTIPQIVFRFCFQLGMICLTGTTDAIHMKEDLDIDGFALTDSEIAQIETIGV